MNNKKVVGINSIRGRSGGAKTHITNFFKDLTQNDLKLLQIETIHIWCSKSVSDDLPTKNWLVKHIVDNRFLGVFGMMLFEFFLLKTIIKRHRIDVLLNTDAASLCRFSPNVCMSRDLLPYENRQKDRFGFGYQRLRVDLNKLIEKNNYRTASGIIFLNEYARNLIQSKFGIFKNSVCIPHGISKYWRQNKKPKSYNRKINDEVVCIYISNSYPYKNNKNVIIAIDKLISNGHNVSLNLIGIKDALEIIKSNWFIRLPENTKNKIKIFPFLNPIQVSSMVSKSDIFIFASSCENMPNILLEGMAAGVPIASSNYGPMPAILQDAGVYFDPEIPTSISDAVETLIKNSNLAENNVRKAINLSKQYSWRRCCMETLAFVRSVV